MKGKTISEVLSWLDRRMSAFERDRVLRERQNQFIERSGISRKLFDMGNDPRRMRRK